MDNLKIYYLTRYIPSRFAKEDKESKLILELKNKEPKAVTYFYNKYVDFIEKNKIYGENFVIAVVPSHSEALRNTNGTAIIAHKLIDKFNYINGIDIIIRAETTPKKSYSINRLSLEDDIKTLTIKFRNIDLNKKKVILLDDVVTTGNSLKAASYLLYNAGVKQVICIAIGRTVTTYE